VRVSKLKYPAYPNCLPTARYLRTSSEALSGTYVTFASAREWTGGSNLGEGTLERNRGGLKVFYVLTDAKGLAHKAKVGFCSIVGGNDAGGIRLSIQVPPN